MKTPSDNLYRLIHSMTAAEKRYFKRHYSSGKNMLTDLFNFLNSVQEYDEDLVKQHFEGSKLVKNLKVYKVQLSELILKSLSSYNYKSNVRSRIHFGLGEVQILLDKHLYDMARGKIKKIKQLCYANEEFDYLHTVLKMEGQFHTFYNITPGESIDTLFEEIDELRVHLNTEMYLKKITSKLIKHHNTGKPVEEFEDFEETLNYIEGLKPQNFSEVHFRHQSLASLYALIHNHEKELYHKKSSVLLFNTNKKFIPIKVSMYFSAIHNYLSSCNVHRQFEDFDELFNEIKALPQQYPQLDRNFIFILYLKLRSLFQQEKFDLVNGDFEQKILSAAKRYEMDSPIILSSSYLHLATANLYHGKLDRALYFLREVDAHHLQNPPAIHQIGMVLELICHYETNSKAIIDSLVFSLKRRSKKKQFYTPFFKDMLGFFPKVIRLSPADRAKKFLSEFDNLKRYENDACFAAFKSLTLEYWWVAKMQDKTTLEVINNSTSVAIS